MSDRSISGAGASSVCFLVVSAKDYRIVEFTDAPLVEVAARFIFLEPLDRFDLSLISEVHQSVREEFPILGTAALPEAAPGEQVLRLEMGEIAAVEYARPIEGRKVRLQDNLIASYWTKSLAEEAEPYPRYSGMVDTLSKFVSAVASASQRPHLRPRVVNLSYTDFIPVSHDQAGIVEEYLSPKIYSQDMATAPRIYELKSNYQGHSGVDRLFHFQRATLGTGEENRTEGYLIRTSCGINIKDTDDYRERLDSVHAEVLDLFLEALSEKAKERWGYVRT
jgi:uncharacterized protein (TIGR04255 family)